MSSTVAVTSPITVEYRTYELRSGVSPVLENEVWNAISRAFHHKGHAYGLKWPKNTEIYSAVCKIRGFNDMFPTSSTSIFNSGDHGCFWCNFDHEKNLQPQQGASIPFLCVEPAVTPHIYQLWELDLFLEIFENLASHPPFNPETWCLIIDDIDGTKFGYAIHALWIANDRPSEKNPFYNLRSERDERLKIWKFSLINKKKRQVGVFDEIWFCAIVLMAVNKLSSLACESPYIHLPSLVFRKSRFESPGLYDNKNSNKVQKGHHQDYLSKIDPIICVVEYGGSIFLSRKQK